MKNAEYEKGNAALLAMLKSKTFDRAVATQIIETISDLDQPILDQTDTPTTYLFEAEACNNVGAVRFLLEHGANPNLYLPELHFNDCPLYDLHFLWEAEEVEQRLEITKLFFEFGADPNLRCDGETVYDHVRWEVFNDEHTPHDWTYIKKFFLILLAYGGGGAPNYADPPKLTEEIDKIRIDEYDIKMLVCKDGYHLDGHIFNPKGKDIGTI